METKTQAFTIFTEYPSGYRGFIVRCGSLDDCIEETAGFELQTEGFATPVAWDCPRDGVRASCAESIAAGRTIELIDGRYVARGVHTAHDDDAECASCGRTWGEHCNFDCLQGGTTFVKQPKPAQTLGDLLRKAGDGLPSKTPTLDKLENERDPKRAPLPYFAERTPFDPFKGFVCVSSTQHQDASGFSPDLQPSSHLAAPAHGSALLRG